MKRSLVTVLLITSLTACGDNKKNDCIDSVTYENKCLEQAIERQEIPLNREITIGHLANEPTNIWPDEHPNTIVVERKVYIERERPKSSWLPQVGAVVGGWIGKKYADRKAAQQNPVPVTVPQKPPVRVVPIVPNAKPYVPPPKPVYAPPRPTYTAPRPTYTSPTVTVRPSPTPSYRSAPSVTVRSR